MLRGQNSIIAVFDLSWVRLNCLVYWFYAGEQTPLWLTVSGLHSPQIQFHCRDVSCFMFLVALGALSLIEGMSECHLELLPMTTTTSG